MKTPPKAGASWTLTDAKSHLSTVVQRALEGEPQRIVRRGRESVIVLIESAYRPMRPTRSVVELFSALRGAKIDLERSPELGRRAARPSVPSRRGVARA